MKTFQDLKGESFGKWTVVERATNSKHGRIRWLCECSCPSKTRKVVQAYVLRAGGSKSCGCLVPNHGRSNKGDPEYTAWCEMRRRCYNPKSHAFARYGGRGITVCQKWDSFEAFYEDIGPKPSPEHSLDRIDTNGNYDPGNVRWATKKEQARNRRNNRVFEYNGETRFVDDWAEILGAKSVTLWWRLKRYATVEEAFKPYVRGDS